MKKISVIYWSGTGNTELMAKAIAEGVEGVQVDVLSVDQASINDVLQADGVALGCPSMGAEVLEEENMEPFIEQLEQENLTGKPVVLFGSYGWGDGEWMQDWEARMKNMDVFLIGNGLILQEEPTADGLLQCRELAKNLITVVNEK